MVFIASISFLLSAILIHSQSELHVLYWFMAASSAKKKIHDFKKLNTFRRSSSHEFKCQGLYLKCIILRVRPPTRIIGFAGNVCAFRNIQHVLE